MKTCRVDAEKNILETLSFYGKVIGFFLLLAVQFSNAQITVQGGATLYVDRATEVYGDNNDFTAFTGVIYVTSGLEIKNENYISGKIVIVSSKQEANKNVQYKTIAVKEKKRLEKTVHKIAVAQKKTQHKLPKYNSQDSPMSFSSGAFSGKHGLSVTNFQLKHSITKEFTILSFRQNFVKPAPPVSGFQGFYQNTTPAVSFVRPPPFLSA